MAQVIIYANNDGNVSVCYPTNELPIETVLTKDCPQNAMIVDDSIFPQGSDAKFFDAWELNGTTITVNFEKAKQLKLSQYNANAVIIAQKRQLNTLSAIENTPNDAIWLAMLASDRASIESATTTQQLVDIANPS